MTYTETKTCCCHTASYQPATPDAAIIKKTARTVPSVALGMLIAFFPKCPVCWAAYMSMFGSFGLSNLPYTKWLIPVLIIFLCLHLYLILKKVNEKGPGPFVVSLAGALVIIGGRFFFFHSKPILFSGMLFIIAGSLWNSFSVKQFKIYNNAKQGLLST